MKVLLALDDSPFTPTVLNSVLHSKWPEGTQFKIVTVVKPLDVDDEQALEDEERIGLGEIQRRRMEHASKICAKPGRRLKKWFRAVVHFEIRTGQPDQEILATGADWEAARLIIGAHGHNICPHNLSGSISQSVAQRAHCTVEVVRAAQHRQRYAATAV